MITEEIAAILKKLGTVEYMRDRHPEASLCMATVVPVRCKKDLTRGFAIYLDTAIEPRDCRVGHCWIGTDEWESKFSYPEKMDLVRQRVKVAFRGERACSLTSTCTDYDMEGRDGSIHISSWRKQ